MELKDLPANPKNPRIITDEKLSILKKSYETFGPLHGVVFNKTTNRLVGGHQSQKILPPDSKIIIHQIFTAPTKYGTIAQGTIEVDGEKIPYREVQVDEPTEMAMNIAANQHGGEFDYKLLPDVLLELDNANMDLNLTGFTTEELEDILAPTKEIKEKKEKCCPKCGEVLS